MKRSEKPLLSADGQAALDAYEGYLRGELDLRPATIRNYLSDMRQFVAWCEADWSEGREDEQVFNPAAVATPTITRYRAYLQSLELKPTSVNRYLVSLKRYFAWTVDAGLIQRDPARVVKLVEQVTAAPRHLDDREENALVAAAANERGREGPRDYTLIVLMLHTGLRAGEVCRLKVKEVTLGKRSGQVRVVGKRNKYREVPLNGTARKTLQDYLEQRDALVPPSEYLFPSLRTGQALTERALGYIIHKYAARAGLKEVSPHDLRHRFGYRMAEVVPLHRLAQIMGHDSLDTTMIYIRGTRSDLQKAVEKIAWE